MQRTLQKVGPWTSGDACFVCASFSVWMLGVLEEKLLGSWLLLLKD